MKKFFSLSKMATLFAFFATSAFADLPQSSYEALDRIHNKIHLLHGDIKIELPEQLLAATFLPADAKVLEIGADVGRNSCVIASILNDSRNMVSIEPRSDAYKCLKANRNHNGFRFYIEHAAISEVPLVQKGWRTMPSQKVPPGYKRIRTITLEKLRKKYNIDFDTLVVDCEGALYYILQDTPEILDNIKLILIENDFASADHAYYVFNHFIDNGFRVICDHGPAHWDNHSFYQVWSK